jgi:hypothetical protein
MRIHRIDDLTHILRRDPNPPAIKAYKKLVHRPVDEQVLRLVGEAVAAAGVR